MRRVVTSPVIGKPQRGWMRSGRETKASLSLLRPTLSRPGAPFSSARARRSLTQELHSRLLISFAGRTPHPSTSLIFMTTDSILPIVFSIPELRYRSPCLSLALHDVFSGHPIPDLDCHQRLPRRPLHSRAPSSFSPVSLSLSLSITSSPVTPFLTSNVISVSPVVFSIFELRRRFPLSSPVATFSTPTAVSVSLVIFSILSPQHLYLPHFRPRPRQLFPLRLRCCLELASSPATTKLFTD